MELHITILIAKKRQIDLQATTHGVLLARSELSNSKITVTHTPRGLLIPHTSKPKRRNAFPNVIFR